MSEIRETVLSNGLKVLVRESRAAPVVSCWAGYRVGTRNEREGITGASHWVEHMTFKGTARLGKGEIFRLTSRHGGANNGFTTDDLTLYFETLPAEQLELALMIEAERMAAAAFDPEETERERSVILAEREGSENNPHFQLSERMGPTVFRAHPYRWPIIGRRADLETLTRDRLLAHYRTYYAPNNAALAIVGDVDAGDAIARVERWFGGIGRRAAPPPVDVVEPPQEGERRVEVRAPGPAAYMTAAYHAPPAGHPDCYPLILLDAVLSGARPLAWGGGGYMGRTGRIYRALVDERLAVSAGSSFRLSLDPYVFTVSLTLRDGADRSEAERRLLDVVEGAAHDPPTPREMARAVRQTEAQVAYGRDGVTSQAFALLYFELLGGWRGLEAHLDRLRAVTAEDVARAAAGYLRPDNRTVGWFIPEQSEQVCPSQIH